MYLTSYIVHHVCTCKACVNSIQQRIPSAQYYISSNQYAHNHYRIDHDWTFSTLTCPNMLKKQSSLNGKPAIGYEQLICHQNTTSPGKHFLPVPFVYRYLDWCMQYNPNTLKRIHTTVECRVACSRPAYVSTAVKRPVFRPLGV